MGKPLNSWYFIVNPMSGNGKSKKKWAAIQSHLQFHSIDFQVAYTERKGHAIDLAKTAIKNGFRKIIAVGGDGTGHEVVNGIMQQDFCPTTEITFCLCSAGTGNDWVKMHRIPKDVKKWIAVLIQEKTIFQDIGLIHYHQEGRQQKRYFFNVAGLAYDGYLGKMMDLNRADVKSSLHYIWLIVKCLFQYKLKKGEITFDKNKVLDSFYTINIGICKYSGGGIQMVPHAKFDDGKLALTIATKTPKWSVLLATPLFYLGKVNWHPVVSLHQVENINVVSKDTNQFFIEADGEFLGETPVDISILPKALKIIVP